MMKTVKGQSRYIRELLHQDPSRRRRAAEALGQGDERAIYPLLKALRDENPGVQEAAGRSLSAIGGEVVAYMVLPLLRDNPLLRNTAILIIREIGRPAVPLLYPLLNDKDDDVRKFCVELLSDIAESVTPAAIVPLLNDPNQNVRASAAKALGMLMGRDSLAYLHPMLADEEWVVFSVLEAVARLADESSADPVAKLLNSPSEAVRYAAIEALGSIRSQTAVAPLAGHLAHCGDLEKSLTVKTMVQIGITPSVRGVADLLAELFRTGDWDDRLTALQGIMDTEHFRMIPEVIDIAGSLDPSDPEAEERLHGVKRILMRDDCSRALIEVMNSPATRFRGRVIAIDLIGELRCAEAVPSLMKLIEGDVRDVRRASVKALAEMATDAAKDALENALDDPDSHVRKAAIAALGRIGDRQSIEPLLRILKMEKYRDVIEEAVNALLAIDSRVLSTRLATFNHRLREIVARSSRDTTILFPLSQDRDPAVRMSAVASLGSLQSEGVDKRIEAALTDDDQDVRKAAIMAAADRRCCGAAVQRALRDPDMWVRAYAVKAFAASLEPDEAGMLEDMLNDPDIPVVFSAIDGLRRLGGGAAYALLSVLGEHDNPHIRERAVEALGAM